MNTKGEAVVLEIAEGSALSLAISLSLDFILSNYHIAMLVDRLGYGCQDSAAQKFSV